MAASIPTAMNSVPDPNHPLARAFASLDTDQSSLRPHQYSFSPYRRIVSPAARFTSTLFVLRSCSPAAHDPDRRLRRARTSDETSSACPGRLFVTRQT